MKSMSTETQVDLQSIYGRLSSLSQQLFTWVLLRRMHERSRRDFAHELRSLADKVERIEPFEDEV